MIYIRENYLDSKNLFLSYYSNDRTSDYITHYRDPSYLNLTKSSSGVLTVFNDSLISKSGLYYHTKRKRLDDLITASYGIFSYIARYKKLYTTLSSLYYYSNSFLREHYFLFFNYIRFYRYLHNENIMNDIINDKNNIILKYSNLFFNFKSENDFTLFFFYLFFKDNKFLLGTDNFLNNKIKNFYLKFNKLNFYKLNKISKRLKVEFFYFNDDKNEKKVYKPIDYSNITDQERNEKANLFNIKNLNKFDGNKNEFDIDDIKEIRNLYLYIIRRKLNKKFRKIFNSFYRKLKKRIWFFLSLVPSTCISDKNRLAFYNYSVSFFRTSVFVDFRKLFSNFYDDFFNQFIKLNRNKYTLNKNNKQFNNLSAPISNHRYHLIKFMTKQFNQDPKNWYFGYDKIKRSDRVRRNVLKTVPHDPYHPEHKLQGLRVPFELRLQYNYSLNKEEFFEIYKRFRFKKNVNKFGLFFLHLNKRLDLYLRKYYVTLKLNDIRKLISYGNIMVNGKVIYDINYIINVYDIVSIGNLHEKELPGFFQEGIRKNHYFKNNSKLKATLFNVDTNRLISYFYTIRTIRMKLLRRYLKKRMYDILYNYFKRKFVIYDKYEKKKDVKKKNNEKDDTRIKLEILTDLVRSLKETPKRKPGKVKEKGVFNKDVTKRLTLNKLKGIPHTKANKIKIDILNEIIESAKLTSGSIKKDLSVSKKQKKKTEMDKYMKIKYLYLNYKKLSKKFKKNKFKLYALRKGFVARASGFRNLKHFLYNDFIKEYSLYKNFTDFQLKRLRMKLQRWYFRMPFRSVYDAIHFHHLEKGLPRFIFPYYFRMLAYGMIFIKRYSFYYFRGKRNIRYCRSGIILRNFRLYLIKYFAKYYQYYRGLFNSKSFLYNFQVYIDPNIYKYDSTLHHCYYYLFPIYHSFISRDINKSSKILANYYRDTSNLSFNYTFFRVFDINDMYSYIRNFTSTHLFDASYNGKFFMILKHDIDIPKNYQYQRDVSHLPFYSKINNNVFKRWVKDRYNIRDNFKNVPYTYNRRRFDYRYDDHFTFSQNSYY